MSNGIDHAELRELERQLTERLELIAPRPRPPAGARVRHELGGTAQRKGLVPWLEARTPVLAWPRLLALGATAVVALAVGMGIGRSVLSTATQSPSAVPSQPVSTASASVLASPQARPDIYQTWDRTNLPQPIGQAPGVPHDVVAFNGSVFIVGGAKSTPCAGVPCVPETTAAVWHLKRGRWERLPDQPGLAAGAMTSAAATTDRLLVLGETTFSPKGTGEGLLWPELWTSTDGVTFNAHDAPAQFTAIAALSSGPAQFLAAAQTDAGPEIWSSADGVAWQREVDAKSLGAGWIQGIGSVAGQIVAVGSQTVPSGNGVVRYQGIIWTSFGGQTWTRSASDNLTNSQINDVAALGPRMVAVGNTGDLGFGLIWASDDAGSSWRRVDSAQVSDPISAVEPTSRGLVAVAGRGGFGLWVSLNGEAWDAVPQQASLSGQAGQAAMNGIAVDPSTEDVYVTGWLGIGGQQRPVVWHSSGARPSSAPSASTGTRLHLWASSTGSAWSEIAVGSAAMLPLAGMETEEMVAFAESSVGAIVAVGRMSKAGLNGISAAWVIRP